MAKLFSTMILFFALLSFPLAQQPTKIAFGPIVTAYFLNLEEEFNELEYQLQHQEISRNDYTRSKQRLLLQKQFVERHAIASGEDTVPELQVLTANEITTMLGIEEMKGQSLRVGDVLGGKWQISGIEKRGERFFILERNLKDSARQTRPKINPLDILETITVYEPDPEELRQARAAQARPAEPPPQMQPPPKVVEIPRPNIRGMYLPFYTPKARAQKVEGKVVLSAMFTRDGKIRDLVVEQKLGSGLDESALEAARKLTFDPPVVNGQPIDVQAHIVYLFTLAHTSMSIQPVKGGQP
ncbi:MAG: energy transducer TonB [Blastocatellia bacterium]